MDNTEEVKESLLDKHTDYCQTCYENIKYALENITANKITVLTGDNATGKSMVRKLIWSSIAKQLGKRVPVADSSMERRTGLHSELGGLGVFHRDFGEDATSVNTFKFLINLLKVEDRYIVIDEPEIGLSDSAKLGLTDYLNKHLPKVMKNNYGVLIITHSKDIVRNLNFDEFINLQRMSKDEWLDKEPEHLDIDDLMEKNNALFLFLLSKIKPANK